MSIRINRTIALALTLGLSFAVSSAASAQTAPTKKAAATSSAPKAGPGEKVCHYKFPDGTPRAWVCKKEEPCCAWDAIKYVKCGSVTFNCL